MGMPFELQRVGNKREELNCDTFIIHTCIGYICVCVFF